MEEILSGRSSLDNLAVKVQNKVSAMGAAAVEESH